MDSEMKGCEGRRAAAEANVDERGRVLYLDGGRLRRKERGKEVFKNHPHGAGVKDAFWSRFSARPWNFPAYAKAFHLMKTKLWWTEDPESLRGKVLRGVLMMNSPEKGHSGGTVYNLNVDIDLSDARESVIVPMDLVKHAIGKADFIGAMEKCLCREANGCELFPHDLACLFLGKSGKAAVEHGIAHEATKE